MTLNELDCLDKEAEWWRGVGHSSKLPIHINKLKQLIKLARRGAEVSDLERAAARRSGKRRTAA